MAKPAISKLTAIVFSILFIFYSANFLVVTFLSSLDSFQFYWPVLIFIVSLSTVIGVREEYRKIDFSSVKFPVKLRRFQSLNSLLIIVLNTLVTHFVEEHFEVSAVFAATLICLISAWIFPQYEGEAYSGSVAGMMGAYLYTSWKIGLLTSLVTGVIFFLFLPFFKGVGGRGGTVSYIGTMLAVETILALKPVEQSLLAPEFRLLSFPVLLVAASFAYFLHERKILSIVKAAMLTAFIFSVLFPAHLAPVISAAFSGAIVGMSTENRVTNYTHLLAIASINFILFVSSYHLLDGIGGKAGLISLLSYFASIGFRNIYAYLKQKLLGNAKRLKLN